MSFEQASIFPLASSLKIVEQVSGTSAREVHKTKAAKAAGGQWHYGENPSLCLAVQIRPCQPASMSIQAYVSSSFLQRSTGALLLLVPTR
jgi:hypothetical protein